jgi:hypothetical protein
MADVTYPPLDHLKPVADNVWLIDSGPMKTMGLLMPVRMTVIRLGNGDLLLHSPTRFSMPLKAELDALGPVRHLIAPNIAHWTFIEDWQSHYPDAETWAAPGLKERGAVARSRLRIDHVLSDEAPSAWAGEIAQVVVPGGANFHEVAFFHQPSRTLVLTDLVVNLEPQKLPPHMAVGARLIGSAAPDGKAPVYLRLVIGRQREAASKAAQQLIDFAPERVIFAHGDWFETNGTERLRQSLHWLTK